MKRLTFAFLLVSTMIPSSLDAQTTSHGSACIIVSEKPFSSKENVRLARPQDGLGSIALFKDRMHVNTDGAPTSYHPDDFLGRRLAINRIDNGIAISRRDGQKLSTAQKIEIFDTWRRSPNWTVPDGYRISWTNVIAADVKGHPCIFQQENAGYFGSLTSLKNGLPRSQAGECGMKDQLDQRYIPAIALRGATNPLRDFGAGVGDLVLAVNPVSGNAVAAIIGDTGNGNDIGEGSVALNMALKGVRRQPTTYTEALALDTGRTDIAVAVLPGTRRFQRVRPYTAQNINDRVQSWAAANGYGSIETLKQAVLSCSSGL